MGRTNVHKAPGWSQLSKTDKGALERNDPTRTRPIRRPRTARHGAPDRMMSQGIKQKMGHRNMHKAPGHSQLRKTDTGALERNVLTRTRPVRRPHTVRHGVPERLTMPQGRKYKMGCANVHKAPGWSQLTKTDTGTLE